MANSNPSRGDFRGGEQLHILGGGAMNGITRKETAEEYFATEALSNGGISKVLECPAKFLVEEKQTDAYLEGSVFHTLILEPELYHSRYFTPQHDGRTKAGQEERSEAKERGLQAVKLELWEECLGMGESVRNHPHPYVGGLFKLPHQTETSLYWDEEGTQCRARVDMIVETKHGNIFIDFKKTRNANPARLSKAVDDYGYYRQAAWYLRGGRACGLNPIMFVFIFVEPLTRLITPADLTQEALQQGEYECLKALGTYRECKASGKWPCYTNSKMITLDLPAYAYNR